MAKSTLQLLRNASLRRVMRHINHSASSLERIAEALEPNQEGVCDDCLSIVADVTPRQQVNQICRGLAARNVIDRSQRECSVCGRQKLVNLPLQQESHRTGTAKSQDVPALLDQHRRHIVEILNSIENQSSKGEGLAARIIRLREKGKLPGSIACMMQTLNSLRNLAVYEEFASSRHELAVIEGAWAVIKDWRDKSINAAK
jgi:hypothetical protein